MKYACHIYLTSRGHEELFVLDNSFLRHKKHTGQFFSKYFSHIRSQQIFWCTVHLQIRIVKKIARWEEALVFLYIKSYN